MTRVNESTRIRDWVLRGLSAHRRHVIAALVFGFLALSCSAMLMFTAGYLICRTAQPLVTLFMVMIPVAFVQLFGLGRPIARYLERLISHDWVFRLTSHLRLSLFRGIAEKTRGHGENRAIGEYLDMLSDDVGHLQNLYLRSAFPIIMAMLVSVAFIALCAVFSPTLALVATSTFLVCAAVLPMLAFGSTRAPYKELKAEKTEAYARLTDDIMGATDWSLSGRAQQAANSHLSSLAEMRAHEISVRRRTRIIELVSGIVLATGAFSMVMVCASEFGTQPDSSNFIAAFALGFFPIMEAVLALPFAFAISTSHLDALERLHGIVVDDGTDSLASGSASSADTVPGKAEARENSQPVCSSAPKIAIEAEGVFYRYHHAQRDALRDINLFVPVGQKVAILGRSGSGKSTLANMIRGELAPDLGKLRLLGNDVQELLANENGISDVVSYIPQRPYLFDRSLRENIAIANPHATDEEIYEAIARVGLADRVKSLQEGLDTHIGDTGFGFSGGEAHRIALARALVAYAPIVIFDEPFTALDTATEQDLLVTLFDVLNDRTLIVITHHLMGIERFDRVLFVEDGCIDLDGTPSELASNEARFRELLEFDRAI